jgi:hypothetical protein
MARQADLLEIVDAASRTFWTAGTSSAIKMAMMAMTTSNSIRVKAERFLSNTRMENSQQKRKRKIYRRDFSLRGVRAALEGS